MARGGPRTEDQASGSAVEPLLSAGAVAVAGASANRDEDGNEGLRADQQAGLAAHPVHPRTDVIEGARAYPDLASLPEGVRGLSLVTPPAITEALVEQAPAAGIENLWMQPGAESAAAVRRAEELGLSVIAGGACVLVALRFRG